MFEALAQNYREYIENELEEPLEAGRYYEFSVLVSTNEDSINYSSCLQAYFSSTPVLSTDYYVLPLVPQWKNDDQNFIRDTLGWQYLSGKFKAAGGEKYVTIGCFDDSVHRIILDTNPSTTSDLYYFIDDIALFKSPVKICTPNIFTPNQDGVNDLFEVYTEGLTEYHLNIYNRWGNKMKEINNSTRSWDGKNAADGVYFYIFRSEEEDITEQGYFQLIR